jgi:serine protease Do
LGNISAKNRAGGRALQTDANVSPANYGGPLIDAEGRMYGICVPLNPNSLDKGAGVEWYDSGIGFAIPLHGLDERLAQMKEGQNFFPAYLGVVVTATADDQGVRVVQVDSLEARRKAAETARLKKSKLEEREDDSEDEPPPTPVERERPEEYDYPAFDAGILEGDRITSVNDLPTRDARSLRIALGRFNAGDQIDVHVLRDDLEKTIPVKLGRPPKSALTPHQLPSGASQFSALLIEDSRVDFLQASKKPRPAKQFAGPIVSTTAHCAGARWVVEQFANRDGDRRIVAYRNQYIKAASM